MPVPTPTTLCHLLPDLIETIAGCRIMYFFAGEGMIAAKGKVGITDNDYRISATCYHFRETHCQVTDYTFLCGIRNSNN